MNWDAIGAIGDLVSGVGVVVTLGYLGIQVGHARQEARRALRQGRGEAVRSLFAFAAEERVNRYTVKALGRLGVPEGSFITTLMNQAGLSQEEAFVLFNHQNAWWNYVIQVIPNIDDLSDMERAAFDFGNRRYAQGVGRLYYEWAKGSGLAHPATVRYIDNVLAQAA
jgi:hypothetical protein